jgi:hypothetical protein
MEGNRVAAVLKVLDAGLSRPNSPNFLFGHDNVKRGVMVMTASSTQTLVVCHASDSTLPQPRRTGCHSGQLWEAGWPAGLA